MDDQDIAGILTCDLSKVNSFYLFSLFPAVALNLFVTLF